MRGKRNKDLQKEALRLRIEERLPYSEICKRLGGIAKGTLSGWLSGYPLSNQELFSVRSAAHKGKTTGRKKVKENPSKYYVTVAGQKVGADRKGRIAEAAILFRLALHGIETYGRVFDGQTSDWIVRGKAGGLRTVQVRIARWGKYGEPVISLMCANGRHSLKRLSNCDILIGYDLYRDIAYVFELTELSNIKTRATVKEEAAERWDKV